MSTHSLPVVSQRPPMAHTYLGATRALCSVCSEPIDARIHMADGKVFLEKFCVEHGHQRCLVASSADWYLDALTFVAPSQPPAPRVPVARGCPLDCGPCATHQQRVALPVIPITSACNLDCPICYTINKNDAPFHLAPARFAEILAHLRADHPTLDIINFTGGEPTMHPQMLELLAMARDAGIHRLTVSTNGLKLLDEGYVQALAALGARVVLSLDTFDPAIDKAMLGASTVAAKRKVLDLCEKHDVTTTLLPAVALGLNSGEVGALFDTVLARTNLCSLELHTLTFTGERGAAFTREARITVPDLHALLDAHTHGRVSARDFVPSPLAHPHCYSICYLLMLDGGGYVPFTRLMPRAKLYALLGESLYIEPGEAVDEAFRAIIDELWADPDRVEDSARVLATLKRLLRALFPSPPLPLAERQRVAERAVKAVYIHSHMDADNFDVSRVMKCCVGVPEADGTNIPTCSYNALYRERDRRFSSAEPRAARRSLPIARTEVP